MEAYLYFGRVGFGVWPLRNEVLVRVRSGIGTNKKRAARMAALQLISSCESLKTNTSSCVYMLG